MRKRFIHGERPVGVRIPGVEGGTHGIQPYSTAEGLARLETAAGRLERECPTRPNPVFGVMTHEEWMALHVNHARLHFGFFIP